MWRLLAVLGVAGLLLTGSVGLSGTASATSWSSPSLGSSGVHSVVSTSSEDGLATVCTTAVPCSTVEFGPDVWEAFLGLGLVLVVQVLLLAVIAARLLTR